ncbi:hypothetical protein MCOR07_002769 [Pyricularia oryzae]|uniref:Uncharacterized protein n=1 Tax=Pyricularia grisea TaxID=148305 RepID=A0ABQ8N622_PYRGI|nr:hypothetical protein MCOR26_007309 [Pyricularia oryzae]KAI6291873.1 hypothetical protein MCOR33_010278 [Pyricularia grisea]KAI6309006.1 hypothetical protein MCOR34_007026 [Pyricularia oryzae]KAI6347123.1 hypothetical protein MCOR30_000441 [Pyricularia oryzae]KAI6349709.1 hypothetical protein MCOR28_000769 [Pyricularia oryzae]
MAATNPLTTMMHVILALCLLLTLASSKPIDTQATALQSTLGSWLQVGKKTADGCSFTKQCPSCESVGNEGMVQCCWPNGRGYGSPFDEPGFCLCAPVDRWDYSMCSGGHWTS